MHRKLQIPFFLLTWIDFSLSICPQGGIPGAIEGSCLFAVKFNASFENAQEFCSSYFGNLVSIRSSEENEKLLEVAKLLPESTKFIWLGGTFDGAKITWLDGSTGGFSYLTDGSLAGNLLLNLTSGKWTTSNWNGIFPFVCLSQPQDPSNQPPICSLYSPCPTDWVYSERLKFCYRVVFNVDFTTADQNCRLMGSQLASIHSEEENDFVNDLSKSGSVYSLGSDAGTEPLLGGKRTGPGQTDWMWVDGTPFNYTRWAIIQPDNGNNNEYCLQTFPDPITVPNWWAPTSDGYIYKWNDIPCSLRFRLAVCKQPAKY